MSALSPDSAAPFVWRLRVYWEDTDAGGVVFYANYLKFFERARTEWLRAHGHAQQRLREETGAVFIVTDTSVRYLAPARLDDLIDVDVRVVRASPARIEFAQRARRDDGTPLAEARLRVACVDAGTFRPRRIPIDLAFADAAMANGDAASPSGRDRGMRGP